MNLKLWNKRKQSSAWLAAQFQNCNNTDNDKTVWILTHPLKISNINVPH